MRPFLRANLGRLPGCRERRFSGLVVASNPAGRPAGTIAFDHPLRGQPAGTAIATAWDSGSRRRNRSRRRAELAL